MLQKTSGFSKIMVCLHVQGGGDNFCDFVRTSFMDFLKRFTFIIKVNKYFIATNR